jgi:CubicO group peptidase (beta-lactamase class C family)
VWFATDSVTKTFTVIAVMQLVEQGLIDLDAPASNYLRAYRLVPVKADWRPATLRHLLTHTAGIREVLHLSGLLRMPDLGETVEAGRSVPSLAEFHRGGLRVDAEPGSRFVYTNHGFATLGQVVEDVSGVPIERYLREHVFEPLGMTDTDLDRSRLDRSRLATAYELRSHGPQAVTDYELIPKGAGAASSTPRDMARYLAALLGGGANQHGSVLEPATLAAMFEPPVPARSAAAGHGAGVLPGQPRQPSGGGARRDPPRLRLADLPGPRRRVRRDGRRQRSQAGHDVAGTVRRGAFSGTCSASPRRGSAPIFRSVPSCGPISAGGTGSPPRSPTRGSS